MDEKFIEELKNKIWGITDAIRGVIYSSQIPYVLLRLLFLKYVIDNFIGADDVESMKVYAEAQRAFAMRDLNAGFNSAKSVLENIDRHFNLEGILSNFENIENYSRELFGTIPEAVSSKKNANEDRYRAIFSKLSAIDLKEETTSSHVIGKTLTELLSNEILNNSFRSSYSAEYTTSRIISKIAGAILEVKDDDVFCDFTSGIGLSTLAIANDTEPTIVSVDINRTVVAASAMLYILNGCKKFSVYCYDTLILPAPPCGGNKIFADPPLGVKVDTYDDEFNGKVDSSTLAVHRATHYLFGGGTAVVAVPGGFLFQKHRPAVNIKANLVSNRYLSAVISLPPLWTGTNIGTNLLVFKKTYDNKNVVFIDASDCGIKPKSSPFTVVSDENIRRIVDIINNPKNIDNFSSVVDFDTIVEHGYDLVPAKYIVKSIEEHSESLEEIDAQLAELYLKLNS